MNNILSELTNSITTPLLNHLPTLIQNMALGYASTLTIYIGANVKRSLKIKKQNKQNQWTLYRQTPDIFGQKYKPTIYAKISKEDLKIFNDILSEMKYPEELTEIVKQFKNHVTPENFKTCLWNLKTVKIKKFTLENDIKEFINNLLNLQIASGSYLYSNNTINLYFTRKSTLSHEFLHMASAIDLLHCGFRYSTYDNQWIEIGRGINEGYTELLNHRIFKSKSLSYYHNVKIARLFETFFDDRQDMENAYFHGDIESLYKVFCEYGTKEEFFKIMNNLDNLATTKIPIYNTITSVQTQLKLYDVIKRSKDKEKISTFETILDENPLTRLIRNGQKLVLANKMSKTVKVK